MSEYLRRLIADEGGSITVERFMQEALYHPEHGYYARNVQTVGRRGDFSTAATLHPALGQAIARWLRAHRAGGTPWHVIELGAGTGELAKGVLASLGWLGRRGLRYHIVEVSPGLREQQQKRLGGRARWHQDIADALAAADGRALIFSNEFVDAFPCQQFELGADGWREVRVSQNMVGTALRAVPDSIFRGAHPASQTPPADPEWDRSESRPYLAGNQRIERHESYRQWLAGWAPRWRAGRLLTIDYGDRRPDLYHRRPHGTLRGYWRHRRIEGAEVFARFGQQDLTADVNFTDLEQWGATDGWHAAPLETQAGFLRAWLPARTLRRADPALEFLLDPDGAGGAFKALEQWPDASIRARAQPDVH